MNVFFPNHLATNQSWTDGILFDHNMSATATTTNGSTDGSTTTTISAGTTTTAAATAATASTTGGNTFTLIDDPINEIGHSFDSKEFFDLRNQMFSHKKKFYLFNNNSINWIKKNKLFFVFLLFEILTRFKFNFLDSDCVLFFLLKNIRSHELSKVDLIFVMKLKFWHIFFLCIIATNTTDSTTTATVSATASTISYYKSNVATCERHTRTTSSRRFFFFSISNKRTHQKVTISIRTMWQFNYYWFKHNKISFVHTAKSYIGLEESTSRRKWANKWWGNSKSKWFS